MNLIKYIKTNFFPKRLFESVSNGCFSKEIISIFILSLVFPFTKSFFMPAGKSIALLNMLPQFFYKHPTIKRIVEIVYSNEMLVFIETVLFFSFVGMLAVSFKILNKKSRSFKIQNLILLFMSLSTFGLILQILFQIFRLLFVNEVLQYGYLLSYIILSILALYYLFKMECASIVRMFFSIFLLWFFFSILGGTIFVFPFLLWLIR